MIKKRLFLITIPILIATSYTYGMANKVLLKSKQEVRHEKLILLRTALIKAIGKIDIPLREKMLIKKHATKLRYLTTAEINSLLNYTHAINSTPEQVYISRYNANFGPIKLILKRTIQREQDNKLSLKDRCLNKLKNISIEQFKQLPNALQKQLIEKYPTRTDLAHMYAEQHVVTGEIIKSLLYYFYQQLPNTDFETAFSKTFNEKVLKNNKSELIHFLSNRLKYKNLNNDLRTHKLSKKQLRLKAIIFGSFDTSSEITETMFSEQCCTVHEPSPFNIFNQNTSSQTTVEGNVPHNVTRLLNSKNILRTVNTDKVFVSPDKQWCIYGTVAYNLHKKYALYLDALNHKPTDYVAFCFNQESSRVSAKTQQGKIVTWNLNGPNKLPKLTLKQLVALCI